MSDINELQEQYDRKVNNAKTKYAIAVLLCHIERRPYQTCLTGLLTMIENILETMHTCYESDEVEIKSNLECLFTHFTTIINESCYFNLGRVLRHTLNAVYCASSNIMDYEVYNACADRVTNELLGLMSTYVRNFKYEPNYDLFNTEACFTEILKKPGGSQADNRQSLEEVNEPLDIPHYFNLTRDDE